MEQVASVPSSLSKKRKLSLTTTDSVIPSALIDAPSPYLTADNSLLLDDDMWKKIDNLARMDNKAFMDSLVHIQQQYLTGTVSSKVMRMYENAMMRIATNFYVNEHIPPSPCALFYDPKEQDYWNIHGDRYLFHHSKNKWIKKNIGTPCPFFPP